MDWNFEVFLQTGLCTVYLYNSTAVEHVSCQLDPTDASKCITIKFQSSFILGKSVIQRITSSIDFCVTVPFIRCSVFQRISSNAPVRCVFLAFSLGNQRKRAKVSVRWFICSLLWVLELFAAMVLERSNLSFVCCWAIHGRWKADLTFLFYCIFLYL